MDKKKRAEEKRIVPPVAHRRKVNWKTIASVVAIVGGLLGISEKIRRVLAERKAPVIEPSYLLLKDDCLRAFVRKDSRDHAAAEIPDASFVPSLLFGEVDNAFKTEVAAVKGRTITAGLFLMVKNISTSEADITFKGEVTQRKANHVAPHENLAYCVRLTKIGAPGNDDPIKEISVTLATGTQRTVNPGPVPSEDEMRPTGAKSCSFLGYPR